MHIPESMPLGQIPTQWGSVKNVFPQDFAPQDLFGLEGDALFSSGMYWTIFGVSSAMAVGGGFLLSDGYSRQPKSAFRLGAGAVLAGLGLYGVALSIHGFIKSPKSFGLGELGQVEYWIVDPEEKDPVVKAQCRPFLVSEGYEVTYQGPRSARERAQAPAPVNGLGQLGQMPFWEVLSPDGGRVAGFRCRPFWLAPGLTLKRVQNMREILEVPGAADEPEGTVRVRRGPLMTVRRG